MRIKYSKKFIKELKKCPHKIQQAFDKRLKLFIVNQDHYLLHNHRLSGKLKDYRSINIDGDYRVLFREPDNSQTICFVAIGTHSKLYS